MQKKIAMIEELDTNRPISEITKQDCLFEGTTLFAQDVYEVDFINVSVDAPALSVDAVLGKQLANVIGVEYVVFIRLSEKVL